MTLIFQDDAPDSAVKSCPLDHWFEFHLVRKPREKPLHYWPNDIELGYKDEAFTANLTDKCIEQSLDGVGRIKVTGIPEGVNDIQFADFFIEIEDWLKKNIDD